MSRFDLMFAEDLNVPTVDLAVDQVVKSEVSTQMKTLAREFFLANAQMNKLKKQADEARKLLYAQMKDAGVDNFSFTTTVTTVNENGEQDKIKHTLDVVIATSEGNEVDIDKLKSLVNGDMFMKIVSATQSSVKEYAGDPILKQCLVKKQGTENVNVKMKK